MATRGEMAKGIGEAGASAAAQGRRAVAASARRARARALAGAGALVLVGASWLSRSPWFLLAASVLASCALWAHGDRDPGRWLRGSTGEEMTAAILAHLPRRFVVIHDRCFAGARGNVDHVVVGPSGIWVVDSKVRRAHLTVRRGQVWAGERLIDIEPVLRQGAYLESLLDQRVRPVVAIHGHGLRRRGKSVGPVLILPAGQLVTRLGRRRIHGPRLRRCDVVAVVAAITRAMPRAATGG